jgi:hypothetical protein
MHTRFVYRLLCRKQGKREKEQDSYVTHGPNGFPRELARLARDWTLFTTWERDLLHKSLVIAPILKRRSSITFRNLIFPAAQS